MAIRGDIYMAMDTCGTATTDADSRTEQVAVRASLLSEIANFARGAGVDGDGPAGPARGQARRLEGGLVAPAVGGLAALAAAVTGPSLGPKKLAAHRAGHR